MREVTFKPRIDVMEAVRGDLEFRLETLRGKLETAQEQGLPVDALCTEAALLQSFLLVVDRAEKEVN